MLRSRCSIIIFQGRPATGTDCLSLGGIFRQRCQICVDSLLFRPADCSGFLPVFYRFVTITLISIRLSCLKTSSILIYSITFEDKVKWMWQRCLDYVKKRVILSQSHGQIRSVSLNKISRLTGKVCMCEFQWRTVFFFI